MTRSSPDRVILSALNDSWVEHEFKQRRWQMACLKNHGSPIAIMYRSLRISFDDLISSIVEFHRKNGDFENFYYHVEPEIIG